MLVMSAVGRPRKCGFLGFAGQPAKPVFFVSSRPVREPVSKIKVASTWERSIYTHTHIHTPAWNACMNTQTHNKTETLWEFLVKILIKKIISHSKCLVGVLFWHKEENLLASSSTPNPSASLECDAVKRLEILPQVNQLPPPQQTSTLS